jgi:hypothetical protein
MDCLVGNGKGGTNQRSQMNLSLSHRFQWHLFEYAPCHARPSDLKAGILLESQAVRVK